MATNTSILAKLLRIKEMHIEKIEYATEARSKNKEAWSFQKIVVHARPIERVKCICPYCRKPMPKYDVKGTEDSTWRGSNLNGYVVEISYRPTRIICPEHGVVTEYIPWQDGKTRFLADFNNDVTFLALTVPKTIVSQYMNINWRTVGNCIQATHNRIEPDTSVRLHGLRKICVDETSYSSGHNYITVVYDMDRNRVVWVHKDHGKEVFSEFCEALSKEERAAIDVVAGDGARWIDSCVEEYFPNAKRCIDFFHVVAWINDALDKTRLSVARKAQREYEKAKQNDEFEKAEKKRIEQECRARYLDAKRELRFLQKKRGRPSNRVKELNAIVEAYEAHMDDTPGKNHEQETVGIQLSLLDQLSKKASDIKGTKYALGMNPENLSEQNRDKLALIEASFPDLYRAYHLKERIRIILHCKDVSMAREELIQWIADARSSGLKEFVDIADKIERHLENILRSVECQANSAKSESTNTTIKVLIKIARGFTNLDNMFSMIMLRCSDLTIPLFNRYQPSPNICCAMREKANQKRIERMEDKCSALGLSFHP